MKRTPESCVGQRFLVGCRELRMGRDFLREERLRPREGRKRPKLFYLYLSLDWRQLSGMFTLWGSRFAPAAGY
jgi:hypothetical protein